MKILPTEFDDQAIRRVYDEKTETWWFSVIDVVQVLPQQADYLTARQYWNKLKERLTKEGSESVTNCHRLKLPADDSKNYPTDVATAETLLRLVQSIPSPKAELIFTALAELSTRQIAEKVEATGMSENKSAAKAGGALPGRRDNNWRARPAGRWSRAAISCRMIQKI